MNKEKVYYVSKYDIADEFGKDGTWDLATSVKGVTAEDALEAVEELLRSGYDRNLSIVVDTDNEYDITIPGEV